MALGLGPKVLKHCPEGHVMQMTWRNCPRCSGRGAPAEVAPRDMADATVVFGAPPVAAPAPAPPPPAWVARLSVERGPLMGRDLEIPTGRWKVGRAPTAEAGFEILTVPDPSMSRDHFVLEAGVAAVVMRDLGSTNGTFVNGTRLEHRVLKEGDVLGAGHTTMRVRLSLKPPA
jgi:hypothetical protein